jgi:hypothetical protein
LPRFDALAQASAALEVEILPWHGSADLATLAGANGLVHLSVEKQQIAAGELLDVVLI